MNELISKEMIESKIYYIRGQKVMLDSDLAKIYGYETKNFNRQVKNNIEKFDKDFMFQLSNKEVLELSRCKNFTMKRDDGRGHNIKYLPYVFTEQGIYMLMTVLRGELAIRQSKALIRIFKDMKDYIVFNNNIENRELLNLSIQVNDNTRDIKDMKENMATKKDLSFIMDNFIEKNKYREFLILNGMRVEASIAYKNIFSLAKRSIYIIDNYINIETLYMLRECRNIDIIIFSDNKGNYLSKNDYDSFSYEYPDIDINIIKTNGIIHDRYIIIDYKLDSEVIYHAGASIKDRGNKVSTIIKIEDNILYYDVIDKLLENSKLELR